MGVRINVPGDEGGSVEKGSGLLVLKRSKERQQNSLCLRAQPREPVSRRRGFAAVPQNGFGQGAGASIGQVVAHVVQQQIGVGAHLLATRIQGAAMARRASDIREGFRAGVSGGANPAT